MKSSLSPRANQVLLEQKYQQWQNDPASVGQSWSSFFEGFELGVVTAPDEEKSDQVAAKSTQPADDSSVVTMSQEAFTFQTKIVSMVYAYRTLGHTQAWLDPLSERPEDHEYLHLSEFGLNEEDLDRPVRSQFFRPGEAMTVRKLIARLQDIYCGTIGFEIMHIHNREVRNWLRDRIENRLRAEAPSREEQEQAYSQLVHAEEFEQFLGRKFVGAKRFSIEGGEGAMVVLDTVLRSCPGHQVEEIVMGMAHRGRLNVLANFLEKPLQIMLYEFSEKYVPGLIHGDGDVKYHLGFETTRTMEDGHVAIHLMPNPSHLEAVNPVVEGFARARQATIGDLPERARVLPILLHGDAAFAGQGAIAEVLNLSQLSGYRTGGTLHLIVNNQIGFTTTPEDARSSSYCSDVGKMIEAPILHVNGDDTLAVAWVAKLAMDFRQRFGRDVIIDMVCYRRQGHNETDQAAFTQPQQAKVIRDQKTARNKYRAQLVASGVSDDQRLDAIDDAYRNKLEEEYAELKKLEGRGERPFDPMSTKVSQPQYLYDPLTTGASDADFERVGYALVNVPDGFKLNETLAKRLIPARREMVESGEGYNWAMAELLAFGTLLIDGHGVRLSGQDSRRGTFSQRHAVFYDANTRERHIPLEDFTSEQIRFSVYNSLLSEAAVLGFDYGYSLANTNYLVMWEAQFGDFANGAQVIIDQFISSSESKWGTPSRICMLLPHGYEGMGPEHSSARLERFLTLCAEGNIQVCNLTSPAQYFHLLRRQALREYRKPLVIMTPKSLLGNPNCVSEQADFVGDTRFHEILDDPNHPNPEHVSRLILCSGKVWFDLVAHRDEQDIKDVAIIRIEQLYPFHWEMFAEITSHYPNVSKWVWCQEEPKNMGAWTYIAPRIKRANGKTTVRYAGRVRAASTATGAKAVHVREQQNLVEQAFAV